MWQNIKGCVYLRVIAGAKRGLKLFEFEGSDIRPTTDRVKENIFNIISPYVYDSSVLDLFCGTGALSVESLSRGAKSAVLCDVCKKSLDLAKKNAVHAGFSDKCTFVLKNGLDFLCSTNCRFDIVFMDPPYNSGLAKKALEAVFEKDVLNEGAIVVLERDEPDAVKSDLAVLVKEKKYGRTHIGIYTKKTQTAESGGNGE